MHIIQVWEQDEEEGFKKILKLPNDEHFRKVLESEVIRKCVYVIPPVVKLDGYFIKWCDFLKTYWQLDCSMDNSEDIEYIEAVAGKIISYKDYMEKYKFLGGYYINAESSMRIIEDMANEIGYKLEPKMIKGVPVYKYRKRIPREKKGFIPPTDKRTWEQLKPIWEK